MQMHDEIHNDSTSIHCYARLLAKCSGPHFQQRRYFQQQGTSRVVFLVFSFGCVCNYIYFMINYHKIDTVAHTPKTGNSLSTTSSMVVTD